jgi:hypothetical protein
MNINEKDIQINQTPKIFNIAFVVGIVSLIVSVVGGLWCARQQLFFSALTSNVMIVGISLGAMIFVMIHHIVGAQWSVAIRRVSEIIMSVIPYSSILIVILLLTGSHDLFEWSHADVVAKDHLIQKKTAYLNMTFFTIRLFFYVLVWIGLSRFYLKTSLTHDQTGNDKLLERMKSVTPVGIILFALTVTFAAFDWIMSLDPHWFSTIFGVYVFAGFLMTFLAVIIVVLRILQCYGYLKGIVTVEHYHDLAKLMFAFTCFWAFCAFSQYMLIWYGNVPEETIWYSHRWVGGWKYISLILPVGHFIIPFVLLMARSPKRNLTFLTGAAVWLVLMEFIDLHWLILPNFHHHGFHLSWLDVTTFIGFSGFFLGMLGKKLTGTVLVPTQDPFLEKSIHHVSR